MPAHKGGKKGTRKHGTGIAKLAASRWGTYAGLIAHQLSRRAVKLLDRVCGTCNTQYHSRGALKRHHC
jgi:hypothetical protein